MKQCAFTWAAEKAIYRLHKKDTYSDQGQICHTFTGSKNCQHSHNHLTDLDISAPSSTLTSFKDHEEFATFFCGKMPPTEIFRTCWPRGQRITSCIFLTAFNEFIGEKVTAGLTVVSHQLLLVASCIACYLWMPSLLPPCVLFTFCPVQVTKPTTH